MKYVTNALILTSLTINGYAMWKLRAAEKRIFGTEVDIIVMKVVAKQRHKVENSNWRLLGEHVPKVTADLERVKGELLWCDQVRKTAQEYQEKWKKGLENVDALDSLPTETLPSGLPPSG